MSRHPKEMVLGTVGAVAGMALRVYTDRTPPIPPLSFDALPAVVAATVSKAAHLPLFAGAGAAATICAGGALLGVVSILRLPLLIKQRE
jgi:hypothetical protein